jgi:hypothetical protein
VLRGVNGTYELQQGVPFGGGYCLWFWQSPTTDYVHYKYLDRDWDDPMCGGTLRWEDYLGIKIFMRAFPPPLTGGGTGRWEFEIWTYGEAPLANWPAFIGTYYTGSPYIDCSAPVPGVANDITECNTGFPDGDASGNIGYGGSLSSPS